MLGLKISHIFHGHKWGHALDQSYVQVASLGAFDIILWPDLSIVKVTTSFVERDILRFDLIHFDWS